MKLPTEALDVEARFRPIRYKIERRTSFYWSPLRQRWIKIVRFGIVPNYDDVSVVKLGAGEWRIIPRNSLQEYKAEEVYDAKGDVVFFDLESGESVIQDSGDDPGGRLYEMLKHMARLGKISKPGKELTNLKGIFE